MFRNSLARSIATVRTDWVAFTRLFTTVVLSCFLIMIPLARQAHLGHCHDAERAGHVEPSVPPETDHAHENNPGRHPEDCRDCYFYVQLASGFEVGAGFIFSRSALGVEPNPAPRHDHEAAAPARQWDSRAPPART